MPYNPMTGEWEPDQEDFNPLLRPPPDYDPQSIATPPFVSQGMSMRQPQPLGPPPAQIPPTQPPPSTQLEAANARLADVQGRMPQQPNPSILRRLGSAAVGGVAGFMNAGGKRMPMIDPGPLQRNILYPGFDRQQHQWQQEAGMAQAGVAQARQQRMDQSKLTHDTAQADLMGAQAKYYDARPEIERLKAEALANKNIVTITPDLAEFVGLDPATIPPEGRKMDIRQVLGREKGEGFDRMNASKERIAAGTNQSRVNIATGRNEVMENVARWNNANRQNIATGQNTSRENVAKTGAVARTGSAAISAQGQQDTQKLRNTGSLDTQKERNKAKGGGGFPGLTPPAQTNPSPAPTITPDKLKRYQDFRKSKGLPPISDTQAAKELMNAQPRR